MSVQDAAAVLGITPDSVRARLRRGTLAGAKVGDSWEVHLQADTIARQGATSNTTSRDATGPDTTSRDINLEPLVEHIAQLEEKVERLTEASTMWQIRARQAEEQLLQLTAGEHDQDVVQDTAPEAAGSPQANETPVTGARAWWRWVWGG